MKLKFLHKKENDQCDSRSLQNFASSILLDRGWYLEYRKNGENLTPRPGDRAQQVKAPADKPDDLFNPQVFHGGGTTTDKLFFDFLIHTRPCELPPVNK